MLLPRLTNYHILWYYCLSRENSCRFISFSRLNAIKKGLKNYFLPIKINSRSTALVVVRIKYMREIWNSLTFNYESDSNNKGCILIVKIVLWSTANNNCFCSRIGIPRCPIFNALSTRGLMTFKVKKKRRKKPDKYNFYKNAQKSIYNAIEGTEHKNFFLLTPMTLLGGF